LIWGDKKRKLLLEIEIEGYQVIYKEENQQVKFQKIKD
jgi:hypothetical protein